MSSPIASQAAAAAAAAAAAVKQAADSLISGSTGSSLDVNSLVSALVKAKTAGPAAAISAQAQSDKTEITGLATLSAAMSGLQSAMAPFLNGNALASFSATLSGDGVTAKAGDGALAGNYSLDVKQVAQAQSITSGTFSNADAAALGSGTLTISLGDASSSKSFQINVDSSNDSLQQIADAINSASDNPGVKATVITGANGQSITLQSTTTGASKTISVSSSATSGPLSQLAVTSSPSTDPNAPAGSSAISSTGNFWTQNTAAQDAQLTINNQLVTSSTNTITGALPGVTLTLDPNNTKTVGAQTLTIASDDSSVEGDVSAFVSAYNAVIDQLNTLAAPGTAGVQGSGGQLLGDEMINQIGAALGSIVGGKVSSGGLQGTLAALGISFQQDTGGLPFAELQINADPNLPTLDDVIATNPGLVSTLFNDTNGIATQLNSLMDTYTSSSGIISSRTDALTADISALSKQQDDLDDFSAQLTSQFNDQFTALNTLLAQAQQNQTYLTALFGGSNSNGALAQNSK
ncbi:flagellar filament capping protein FliD [Paraburkholderia sp. SARCC-3016]|uniref:flagellar filament capping protein FliD n=1 Tax=Paraburkholderia sp. SARCC-3016 TaxID=3058611 RepID=UPI002806D177|nr:flagellar filament capping protein FliD [Paraburkholderia sp. SARCC-3016]MDQ7979066.1 flagellar filament capping protein FliD [Paraburkholderia sp. SARCC-3016]